MNVKHIEDILLYRDVYPEGYCQHLVSEFERLESKGAGTDRQNGEGALKHKKDDHQIVINIRGHNLLDFNGEFCDDIFFAGLQHCYENYTTKYSLLREGGNIRATHMKMQRTTPGGGYHIWHCEQGSADNARRVLTYMLYLNSIPTEDGAETEFLYQKKRVSPVENTMVLWPAAYTHAHRGNAVLGEANKYIVTGWFYYD